jgi:AraC family transcriptional regulator, dual regulator of chb operon
MISTVPAYRWSDTVGAAVPCQILRRRYGLGGGWRLHCHDFAEVFWVVAGSAAHDIAGHAHVLRPGDIVFVRPEDAHSCRVERSLYIVNCSFPLATVAPLASRLGGRWPWRPGMQPCITRLSPAAMRRLADLVDDLPPNQPDDLDRDALLLEVIRLLHRTPGGGEAVGLPAWLQEAVEVFADPRHLPGGTRRLAELAGRSPEHLSRCIRAAQGRTATDLVNAVRLRWAAAVLREDDRPVAAVAEACGLPHQTHFYRLFRRLFATTPQGWRDAAHQVAG